MKYYRTDLPYYNSVKAEKVFSKVRTSDSFESKIYYGSRFFYYKKDIISICWLEDKWHIEVDEKVPLSSFDANKVSDWEVNYYHPSKK